MDIKKANIAGVEYDFNNGILDVLIVTDESNRSIASATFEQIREAFYGNKYVYAKLSVGNGMIIAPLIMIGNGFAVFEVLFPEVTPVIITVRIDSSNNINTEYVPLAVGNTDLGG